MFHRTLRRGRCALRHMAGLNYADTNPLTEGQRSCLRNMYINGALANYSDGSAGNYTNLFMVALGATNTQIGFMATLVQALAALAPLPGAYIAERTRAYRASILWPSLAARSGYLLLVALPFFQIGQPLVGAAILVFATRSLLNSSVGAQWTAAMGEMVPIGMRAAYFSARNFAGGVAVIAGTLVAGQIITSAGFPTGYQVIYLMAALVGFAASYFYARVPGSAYGKLGSGPEQGPRPPARRLAGPALAGLVRERVFLRYVLCACALTFAVNLSSPFISLYQIRVLHFDAVVIGVLASSELAANIIMQRVYGTFLIPRFGDYRVMRVLRFGTTLIPILWLFVSSPLGGVLASVYSGVMWSGHDLANFNVQLVLAPERNRASFIAVNTVLTSMCAALGPVIGGVLTDAIGYGPLFAASGILRLAAAAMLLLLLREGLVRRPASPVLAEGMAVESR